MRKELRLDSSGGKLGMSRSKNVCDGARVAAKAMLAFPATVLLISFSRSRRTHVSASASTPMTCGAQRSE
jgi:hypothetical protein